MRAKDFISEALRPSQYRRYVRPHGRIYDWNKARYREIFGDKYRIYFPLMSAEASDIKPNADVVSALQELGYTVTSEDYVLGYATKGNRKFKIGRILTNEYRGNEAMQDNLIKLFVNDPARAAHRGDLLVVISRHPYDIAGMSTDRGWSSCMNIPTGSMSNYIRADVTEGTLIAYLIKENDKNINNPIARVLIKPLINVNNPNNIVFGVENRVYGTAPKEFAKTVVQWADAINSSKVLTGLFKMPSELYRDDIKSHAWYGSDDEKDQIEAVKLDTMYLKQIPNPSKAVVQTALNRDAHAIRYVKNPDPEQVEWALRADGTTIAYITDPTIEQIRTAINTAANAIEFIKDPSEEIQELAVSRRPYVIRYIQNPSDRIKSLAVSILPSSIQYIQNPSEELQLLAIEHGDNSTLNYIKKIVKPSERVIMAALQKDAEAIRYIENPSRTMQAIAVNKAPSAIRWIDEPSEVIQLLAVRRNGYSIQHISNPTDRVQLVAIRKSKHAYEHIAPRNRTLAAYELFKKRWPNYYRLLRDEGWIGLPSRVDVEIGNIRKGNVYEEQ